MPRTPTIFFNKRDFEKLREKVEKERHASIYAYIKELIEKDIGIKP